MDNVTCGLGPVATGGGRPPCRTITYGLTRATTLGRARVLVADALYLQRVILVRGVSLLGGYRADTWERHLTTTLTTIPGSSAAGHRRTITATGITLTTVVEGGGLDGTDASSAGANSNAVYVDGGTSALGLSSNVTYAGNGGPGTPGAAGTDGADGVPGSAGAAAFDTDSIACAGARAGSTGGTLACGRVPVSGGAGGGVARQPVWDSLAPYLPGSAQAGVGGSGAGGGVGGAGGNGGHGGGAGGGAGGVSYGIFAAGTPGYGALTNTIPVSGGGGAGGGGGPSIGTSGTAGVAGASGSTN